MLFRSVWDVELRARLGPLARSKRLRMVRTVRDADTFTATFERELRGGGGPVLVVQTDKISRVEVRERHAGE